MMEYLVKLRNASEINIPVRRKQFYAEFYPIFDEKRNRLGKMEVKARVFLPEFTLFARRNGWLVDGNEMKCDDDYGYLRAMIYGVVMSILKKPSEWNRLEDRVNFMEPIELRYWGSKFRNVYQKWNNMRKLQKYAKCFIELELI